MRRPQPPILHVSLHLPLNQAMALREGCHRFDFETARYLLRFSRNSSVDDLCSGMTMLLRALDATIPRPQERE